MSRLVGLLCLPATLAAQQPVAIDTMSLRADTYFLSHDALGGRATGTVGATIAAHYIASRCRAEGLVPVGGGYLHAFALEEARLLAGTQLVVRASGGTRVFRYPTDVILNLGSKRTLAGFAGRAVYVGSADDVTGGAVARLDLAGRVAVAAGTLNGAAWDTLAAQGVVGVVQLVADRAAYDLYARSRGEHRLYHADPSVPSSLLPTVPAVVAGPAAAGAILAGTPLLAGRSMTPGPLPNELSFSVESSTAEVTDHNVACLLPGSLWGDTAIAFTAHYDHLGVAVPQADGDSIYNGFSDNAAGVAMLLAIAAAFAQSDAMPRYSMLFLFFGGEERGLLGSDAWVHQPAWPLARTKAVINLDAGAPPAPPTSWRLAGVATTGLGAVALAVGRARGWTITTSAPRPNSDYYPFVRHGVPAVFIIPGPGPYDGLSSDSSAALRRRWDRYHHADDEWSEDFPFAGLATYAAFAYLVARAVDRGAELRR